VVNVMNSYLGDQYLLPAEIYMSQRLIYTQQTSHSIQMTVIFTTGFIRQLKWTIQGHFKSLHCVFDDKNYRHEIHTVS